MWQSDKACEGLEGEQRKACRAGYSDGYHKFGKWSGNDKNYHPEEYLRGYEAGFKDSPFHHII